MRTMEANSRKRTQRNQLRTIVLETVKVAGFLTLLTVVPNVIGAMSKLGLVPSKRQDFVIRKASSKLVKNGLLEWRDNKLKLTSKGDAELRRLQVRAFAKKKPKRWDHKWRVVIFDIPEKRRTLRVRLRNMLLDVGFVRLQDSVWVYPYDCEELITLLKVEFRVGDDVRYMIVDSIERDERLRDSFKL